jgi:hypothetical protein
MPDGTVKCVIGAKTKQEACNELTEVILLKTEWRFYALIDVKKLKDILF